MFSVDLKYNFLNSVSLLILIHSGIIYGGFVRDMILYDYEKKHGISERTYPNDIDFVIQHTDYFNLMKELKKGYIVNVAIINSHYPIIGLDKEVGNQKFIMNGFVSDGMYKIKIDCTVLISDYSYSKRRHLDKMMVDFPINRLTYMSPLKEILYSGSQNTIVSNLIKEVQNKVAYLYSMNTQKKRIVKMLKKGFLVIDDTHMFYIVHILTEEKCSHCNKDLVILKYKFNKCYSNNCPYNLCKSCSMILIKKYGKDKKFKCVCEEDI